MSGLSIGGLRIGGAPVIPARKLNLGSGQYPLEGWTNVDEFVEADVVGDIRILTFVDVGEVRMSHLLEHISWRETHDVLERVRSWMALGGELTVEVPDMEAIMALGCVHPLWFKYVYGDQSHEGEYHLAGFTERMLSDALVDAGWRVTHISKFRSDHKGREGMPCIEARAVA